MAEQPRRIQLKRTKGWRMPPNTVKVDRSTRWGNPFNATQSYICYRIGPPMPLVQLRSTPGLGLCLDLFCAYLYAHLTSDPRWLDPLRGKNLACWCPLEDADGNRVPCHADVLLELANDG